MKMQYQDIRAVMVQGISVSLAKVLQLARAEGTFQALHDTITRLVLQQEAERQGITVTREELQLEVNEFRKQQGLFTAADTTQWLWSRGMELGELGEIVRPRIYCSKLKAAITQELIEAYFNEHRTEYDRAHLSQMVLKERGEARELRFRLEEGADFHLLAREFSLDEATKFGGGYLGLKARPELHPAVAAAVFGARDGDILEPIETKRGVLLLRVERLLPARLDAGTEEVIREQLWKDCLEKLEKEAELHIYLWEDFAVNR